MLIGKRVRALALMYLTRRSDLMIEEVRDDIGLDLIVRFTPADGEGVRQFGVGLRGALSGVTKGNADKVVGRAVREYGGYGPFGFPVCLFFFTMEDNAGWYTWVAEPLVTPDGKAALRMHTDADCKPLDKTALDEIVGLVDGWYEAFFANLIANSANGRRRRRGQPEG